MVVGHVQSEQQPSVAAGFCHNVFFVRGVGVPHHGALALLASCPGATVPWVEGWFWMCELTTRCVS